jgi:prolyl oligopeptidase
MDGTVTDDGRYLILTLWLGTDRNHVYHMDLGPATQPQGLGRSAARRLRCGLQLHRNDGPVFNFWTDRDAPRPSSQSVTRPDPAVGAVIRRDRIPRRALITTVGGVVSDAHSRVRLVAWTVSQSGCAFPTIGSVGQITGSARTRDVLPVHVVPVSHGLRYDFAAARRGSSRPQLDFAQRYETTGVLSQQGRHAVPISSAPQGRARRLNPTCCMDMADSTSPPPVSR